LGKSNSDLSKMSEVRTVYIGNKPILNYVLAITSTKGRVSVQARGRLISKAVSAVEMSKRYAKLLGRTLIIHRIKIGSEEVKRELGVQLVSTISIEVEIQ